MTGKEWWHGWDNEQVRGETRQGDAVLLPGVDVRGLSYREEDLKPVTSKKKVDLKAIVDVFAINRKMDVMRNPELKAKSSQRGGKGGASIPTHKIL